MAVLIVTQAPSSETFSKDAVARCVSAGRALGEVHVLLLGAEEFALELATLDGVTQVLSSSYPDHIHGLAEPVAALLQQIAPSYSHICATAGAFGKNALARLAALLDVMIIPDVVKILGPKTYERPIYAGNALQVVESTDELQILTLRTSAFAPTGAGPRAPIDPVAVLAAPTLTTWLRDDVAASDRPELTSAKTVVSGGRGLGSKENFALIERLADTLGAAVGASRAAVDSGFAPNDAQVGQTGKVVAPALYVAVGISGAIQHLAGMKDSKVIVAINKDEDAPIFQIADYGLVGDLFEIVPELTQKAG